jgi:hypothetical protein
MVSDHGLRFPGTEVDPLMGLCDRPGFDYRDMRFGVAEEMEKAYPDLWGRIAPYCKQGS